MPSRRPAPSPLPMYTVAAIAIGQVLFGLGYVGACEFRAAGPGRCEAQWVTAQALIFGGGSTALGLNTLNPMLRGTSTPRRPATPAEEPMREPAPRKRRSPEAR